MKNKLFIIIFSLILFTLSGAIAFATDVAPLTNKINTDSYNLLAPIGTITTFTPTNLGDYFSMMLKLAIGLCAVLAVVMIVVGGIQWMGDESIFGKTEAKSRILSAILGLLIALGSYVLLNTINPDLLGKAGINVGSVSVQVESNSIYDKPITAENLALCTPVTSGPCTVANLSIFGSKATSMSKICNVESKGGDPNWVVSKTDLSTDNPPLPFSFGLFQINLLANGPLITDSNGKSICTDLFVKNDGSAIVGNDYINHDSMTGQPKYNAKLKTGMENQYASCKSILLNPTENIRIAKLLFDQDPSMTMKSAWKGDMGVCSSAFN